MTGSAVSVVSQHEQCHILRHGPSTSGQGCTKKFFVDEDGVMQVNDVLVCLHMPGNMLACILGQSMHGALVKTI